MSEFAVAANRLRIAPLTRMLRALWWTPSLLLAAPLQAEEATQLPAVVVSGQGDDGVTQGSGSYTGGTSSTATKLPLTQRQTPQAVTVVTRDKMDDFAQHDINRVLDYVPGVTVERIETDRSYYTSRGFDITNFQVDGVGLPLINGNLNGDLDTAIYDRVEVLRGANGLMSGSGNPSATVNLVRKRPTHDTQAALSFTGGSWDQRRVETDLSGSLVSSETVRGRVVLVKEDSESYLDRYAKDKATLYGIIEADVADGTLLTLGAHYQQNNADSPLWGALPLYYSDGSATHYATSTSTSTDWAYWNVEKQNYFIELTQALANGWQGKLAYNFSTTKQDSQLFYVYGTPNKDSSSGSGLYSYPSQYSQDYQQHVVDLYASGPLQLAGREHQLVGGLQYARDHLQELSWYSRDIGTEIADLDSWDGSYTKPSFDAYSLSGDWDREEMSAYLAGRFNLTDALHWTLGGRLARYESTGVSYGEARASKTSGKLLPYTGLVYDLTEQLSLYASYATIFTPQTDADENGDALDPMEGVSYEGGVKGEFYQGRLNTTVSVFRSEQDNVAEAAGTRAGTSDTYYRGVDGVTSQGYELEASGELLPNWQLAGGYTQLSIEDADGNKALTYVPRQLVKLATSYKIRDLKLGAALKWQGDIYRTSSINTEIRQKQYALLDLMARYQFTPNAYLALNVNNVANQKYINSLYWEQGYYGAPRSLALTAGLTF
ncbi:TonB-dependent siderophore receptor [Pseudaeromonas sp. ZJS20]|uniref:TonB-dependent siderophore receptor n=1 Tax=Pseudaeromonas aegiceratis TaxID=3153928 RepID=UPI00390C511C